MDTKITDQKFFQDTDGHIHCIDIMGLNTGRWELEIKNGWKPISKNQALNLLGLSVLEAPETDRVTATNMVLELRKQCDLDILPLQDAVDLGDATFEESELLNTLKQFRISLNRWSFPDEIPYFVKKS